MRPKISTQQAKILAYFLERGPFKPSARFVDYKFEPDSREPICLAIAQLDTKEEQDIYGMFNLPSDSDEQILVTITDGDPDKVANSIARLVDYSRSHAIAFGHTFQLEEEPYLQECGRVATLLLRVDAAKSLSRVPETITIDGKRYQTHLVVFLDSSEYQIKRSQGLVSLLDDMESKGRDLVRFVANERLQ